VKKGEKGLNFTPSLKETYRGDNCTQYEIMREDKRTRQSLFVERSLLVQYWVARGIVGGKWRKKVRGGMQRWEG